MNKFWFWNWVLVDLQDPSELLPILEVDPQDSTELVCELTSSTGRSSAGPEKTNFHMRISLFVCTIVTTFIKYSDPLQMSV